MSTTFDTHKNFATSSVATAPSPATSGTSLVVTGGTGSAFPTPPFNAVIWPASTTPTAANAEVVRVTNISTDTFTIIRAQESSSARTVVIGDQIANNITGKLFTDIEGAVNNLENGVTGKITNTTATSLTGILEGSGGTITTAVAGTDYSTPGATETLTNKNVTSGTNTFPTFNQNTTGSAATLTTPRTINGTSFNGSANITVTAAAGTLTGTTLNSTVVTSSITALGTLATLTVTAAPTFSAMTSGSVPYFGTAGLLSQDNANFAYDSVNSNLRLGPTSASISSENKLSVIGNANDYHGTFTQNKNAGTTASTDIVVGNDLTVADTTTYADFGVNSSGNTNVSFTGIGGSDAYLFTSGQVNNLVIATGTAGKIIKFLAGGTLTANEVGRFTSTGLTVGLAGTTNGTIKLSGSGSGTTTLQPATAASGTITLPASTGTVQLISTSTTAGPGATPTIATIAGATTYVDFTALAAAITSMTTNLTGTPVRGDKLWISFTDNGTARAITWGASFEASTVALPTTTVISTRLDVGFIWNTATSKWRCVAVA